jgi:hypothetical protein
MRKLCLLALVLAQLFILVPAASGATWYLRNSSSAGPPSVQFEFGSSGAKPITGDWNGDGCDTVGQFWPLNTFQLATYNATASPYTTVNWGYWGGGELQVTPLTGRFAPKGWNLDTVGVSSTGTIGSNGAREWLLHDNSANPDGSLNPFIWGDNVDIPIVGDWMNRNVDDWGLVRGSLWRLTQGVGGNANISFNFGTWGDIPFLGDWNGDGKDTPGIWRPSNHTFYLNGGFDSTAETVFSYGSSNHTPVVGDWNCDGLDTIGTRL